MGLGIAGGGVEDALFFVRQGAKVIVTDLKSEQHLQKSVAMLQGKNNIMFHLGGHQKQDFTDVDLVVQNPGVSNNSPYLDLARNAGVRVEMGSGIFAENADMSKVIGITGTKGKSTTSALVHRVLKIKHPDAYRGGDVDGSPLKFVEQNQQGIWGVLEISSWRLEGMAPHKKSPHIGVITNIAQDHLNRYESYQDYINAKKLIVEFQRKDDVAILNYDDPELRNIARTLGSDVLWVSAQQKPPAGNLGCYKDNGVVHCKNEQFQYTTLQLKTMHHPVNIMIALTIADIFDIPMAKAKQAIESFEGLFGRLQFIREINKTSFYNDTAATNPYATLQSIGVLDSENLALIVGGEDKNMDFTHLAIALEYIPFVFVLPGTGSEKILRHAQEHNMTHLVQVQSLEQAVHKAYEQNPQSVLFSPAAASFNMFKNEFERGEQFIDIVNNLPQ